jgi:PhnB protein
MSASAGTSIVRTVEVGVDPATAFKVFTDEIDAWYRRGPHSWNDPRRAVGIRFEPRVGGRWIEVWDRATGEGYEIGRIRVWEPGRRLLMTYRHAQLPPEPLTEIEVRFEAVGTGTRVTVEHRGWDRLPPDHFRSWQRRAWLGLTQWFREYADRGKETVMTAPAATETPAETQAPPRPALVPYICCAGAARAIEFYKGAFGAVELSRWTAPDGQIGHAEIRIGQAVVMLADEFPEIGVKSPTTLGGSPVSLHLEVPDVDAVARDAVAAGARLLRPVADQSYGDRNCKLEDPFGHVWMVSTHKEDVSRDEIQKRAGGQYEIS